MIRHLYLRAVCAVVGHRYRWSKTWSSGYDLEHLRITWDESMPRDYPYAFDHPTICVRCGREFK